MQIQIKNIGKIKHAELCIPSIAVIAGENNTGKSTISKSIYSFFHGTKDLEEAHLHEQFESVSPEYDRLKNYFFHKQTTFEEELFIAHFERLEIALANQDRLEMVTQMELLKDKIDGSHLLENEKKSALYELDNFMTKLSVDVGTSSYKLRYLEQVFKSEFSNAVCSTYLKKGSGEFSLGNNRLLFQQNKLDINETNVEHFKNLGAIYIDNPFVVDELFSFVSRRSLVSQLAIDHNTYLQKLLLNTLNERNVFDAYVHAHQFHTIFEEVLDGFVKTDSKELQFEERKTGTVYPLKNLATGMKAFLVLQLLIESGELQKNDILILDEPEVNLHPKWQLKYAELIILLSIRFRLKVLVTSHSPYFIEAIEQYSKKHNIVNEVTYYRTENTLEGNILKDVTNDLPKLYTDFAAPFIDLEKMRDEYEDVE